MPALPSQKQLSFTRTTNVVGLCILHFANREKDKVFEVDPGQPGDEKFFVTFPFPYMNGKLHLGHGMYHDLSTTRHNGAPLADVSFPCSFPMGRDFRRYHVVVEITFVSVHVIH